ncbi:oligosaccharide flippase family protein [Pseudoalteromonas sp. C2R02]|uniref:oligosaccharide flippase family protein n=1 Tax=Pseudoalteromonas sp. C2R02 TaxID=2841565 RepID=UPI001C09634B|nr:oligosaccharide flippase family protein [Pseudoalteromonas sp. C2R02]MBU2968623.1 oligosaccharide flippase family protein [Pseudoalteromonas sp. C2R02]
MLNLISKSLLNSILSVFFGFLFSVIIARVLGAEDRGILGVLLFVSSIVSSISQLGLSSGYIYSSRYLEKSSRVLILKTILIIVFFSLIIFIIGINRISNADLHFFSYYLIITSVTTTVHMYLLQSSQVDERLLQYNLAKFSFPLFNSIGICLLWFCIEKINIIHIITLNVFSMSVCCLILLKGIYNYEKLRINKDPLFVKDIFNYSLKMYATNITGVFLNSIDKFILMKIGSFSDVGIYLVAFSTSRLIGIIPETISTIIFSKYAGKNQGDSPVIISYAFTCLLCPLLLFGCVIYGVGYFMVPIIFGISYSGAIHPFGILVLECILSSTGWILAQRFNVSGKPGLVFFRQIISILPLLLLFLIPTEGEIVIYISIALLFCSLFRLFITLFQYKFILNEPVPSLIPKKHHYSFLWSVINKQ